MIWNKSFQFIWNYLWRRRQELVQIDAQSLSHFESFKFELFTSIWGTFRLTAQNDYLAENKRTLSIACDRFQAIFDPIHTRMKSNGSIYSKHSLFCKWNEITLFDIREHCPESDFYIYNLCSLFISRFVYF